MKKILENKWLLVLLLFVYVILVYCAAQTFIINDDLPYSMYYRGEDRITNIKQVILNQMQDYSNISARIFIHMVVQSMLIFDKNLWMFLNPLVIIATVLLMAYIIKIILGDSKKVKIFWLVIASLCAYLLLYNHKNIIYWVAGSVNYVWVFALMLLFMIYILKGNLFKHPVCSFVICLVLSMIHECLAIFTIVFLIVTMAIHFFKERGTLKKDWWKYLFFLLASIVGFCFIMLSPSTAIRTVDGEFASLSLVEKLFISIPVISTNLFGLFHIRNLFPLIFAISIAVVIFNKYNKYLYRYLCLLMFIIIFGIIFNNGWIWFILGIFLLAVQTVILLKERKYMLISFMFAAYAVSYSLAITTEFTVGRPNYHFFLIVSIISIYNVVNSLNSSLIIKFIKVLLGVSVCVLLASEVYIYHYIGEIKKEREISIMDAKKNNKKLIKLKEMKEPFVFYHMDPNSPSDSSYWAYKHFLHYYELNDDVETVLVK